MSELVSPSGVTEESVEKNETVVNPVTAEADSKETTASGAETAVISEDEMSFEEMLEASLKNLNTDQKVKGVVLAISPTEIQVDIGRKQAGFVPADELTYDPSLKIEDIVKIGDVIDLVIMKTNDQEGTILLSKKRFDRVSSWDDIVKAEETGEILKGTVTEIIRGGIIVTTIKGARIFVPASLVSFSREEDLSQYKGQEVEFKVIEVNTARRRAVGSIKAVLRSKRNEERKALWESISVGNVYQGTVKSLTSYGAFVDIGGVDGMIHVSELAWSRIKHPSEVVAVGDVVEVTVKAVDEENRKISLGYKKTEDNPWEILKNKYSEGDVATVKIVSLTPFGAFAELIPNIDGLIHISQIANKRIDKPADVLSVGDEVEAKITEIDYDKKRVSLSIRALLPTEEVAEDVAEEVAEEVVASTEDVAEDVTPATEIAEEVVAEAPAEETAE